MIINYNVSGSERKRLALALAEHIGEKAKYLGAPKFDYQVGSIIISSDGKVTIENPAVVPAIVRALREKGFQAEGPLAEAYEQEGDLEAEAADGLTVSVAADSLTEQAMANLENLLQSKGSLLCKALAVEALPIEKTEDVIYFPWFHRELSADEVQAYTSLIISLVQMAKTQNRISDKEKPVDNEKYAFRCFLLRLGFIGDEQKQARKVLLRNLAGNSAFKSGAKEKEA